MNELLLISAVSAPAIFFGIALYYRKRAKPNKGDRYNDKEQEIAYALVGGIMLAASILAVIIFWLYSSIPSETITR